MYGFIKCDAKHVHGPYGHKPALGSGWTWPAALRRPQKHDAPGFVNMYLCQVIHILSILGLPGLFVKKFAFWTNDYAS